MQQDDRSAYYQSVERNRGGITSPRRLGLDGHIRIPPLGYQSAGSGRHPPFIPPSEVFYDTKSAGITYGSPQRGVGTSKGLSERTAALLSHAAQGTKNPVVEVMSISRNNISGAVSTADVAISTRSTTMTPPVKILSRSMSILSLHRYPSVSASELLAGELVQVYRSGFWLDALIHKVCIDGYCCKINPLPQGHPLSSSSLDAVQRYGSSHVRKAVERLERGEYCKYAPKGLYVQIQQVDYVAGEAQVRFCGLDNTLRKLSIKDLRKEPTIQIGDYVKTWQVDSQTWRTCSVVGIGDDGYRCDDWRIYPRTLVRLKRPAFDFSILSAENEVTEDTLLSHPFILDYYKRPASMIDASASHTNFKNALTQFKSGLYPNLESAMLGNSRAEPDYGHGPRSAPKFAITDDKVAFHSGPYSLTAGKGKPIMILILILAGITCMASGVGLVLPEWRTGSFKPPFNTEDVTIGLYSVIVPFADSRSTSTSKGYSRMQELLFPDSDFKNWTRPVNLQMTVAGIDWDKDDMTTFKNAGLASLIILVLSILTYLVVVERYLSRSISGFTTAIFVKGIITCCAVGVYSIILSSVSFDETHALLGHGSDYGASWIITLVAGVIDIISSGMLGIRIATSAIAIRNSEIKAATCVTCHRDITSCMCGTGSCRCPGCAPSGLFDFPARSPIPVKVSTSELLLQDVKALPPLEADATTPQSISRKYSKITTDSLLHNDNKDQTNNGISVPPIVFVDPKEEPVIDARTPTTPDDSPTVERIKTVPSITKLRKSVVLATDDLVDSIIESTPPEVPPTPPRELNTRIEIYKENTKEVVDPKKGSAPPPARIAPPSFPMPVPKQIVVSKPDEKPASEPEKEKSKEEEKEKISIPNPTCPPKFSIPLPTAPPKYNESKKDEVTQPELKPPVKKAEGPPPPKMQPPSFQMMKRDEKSKENINKENVNNKGNIGKAPPGPALPPPKFPMVKPEVKIDKVEKSDENAKKWAPPPPTAPKSFSAKPPAGVKSEVKSKIDHLNAVELDTTQVAVKKNPLGPPPPMQPPPAFQMKKTSSEPSLVQEDRTRTLPVVKQDDSDVNGGGVFNYAMTQSDSGSSPRDGSPPAVEKRPKLSFKASRPPQILNPEDVIQPPQQPEQENRQKKEKRGVFGFLKKK